MDLEWRVGDKLPQLWLPKPARPNIYMLTSDEPYCTVQQHAGWSKYKELDEKKWTKMLEQLIFVERIPIVQIDPKQELPLATVIAQVANATMHIGIDSFANHLTHYRWDGKLVPGVILWGSTQWNAAGYPTNINISKGLECQPCFRETNPNSLHPRGPCINVAESGVHACMDQISVVEILEAATKLWSHCRASTVHQSE